MQNSNPIYRQRLVIEGIYEGPCPPQEKAMEYIKKLSEVVNMTIVHGPFVGNWANQMFPKYGDAWEGFAIWAESGVHMYVWDVALQGPLLTIDMYTCKQFDPKEAVEFTKEFFNLKKVAYTEVEPPLKDEF